MPEPKTAPAEKTARVVGTPVQEQAKALTAVGRALSRAEKITGPGCVEAGQVKRIRLAVQRVLLDMEMASIDGEAAPAA